MFYCFIHNWYSTEAPRPVCYQPQTTTATTHTSTASEENKSNDSFQWTDTDWSGIVADVKRGKSAEWLMNQMNIVLLSKQSHTPKSHCLMCNIEIESGEQYCPFHKQPIYPTSKPQAENKPESIIIHSLKRTDGKIIAIGDEYKQGEVKSMRVVGNEVYAHTESVYCNVNELEENKKDGLMKEKRMPPFGYKQENKPDRDWEIVTCFNNVTHDWQNRDWHWYVAPGNKQHITNCEEDKCRIRSVRRLSDGEVFSVGDEVEYKCDDAPWDEFWLGKIESIKQITTYSKKNQIEFRIHDPEWKYEYVHKFIANIRHAKKLPPQPQKEEQRIEVTIVRNAIGENNHLISSSMPIPTEKIPVIKQAIEDAINGVPTASFINYHLDTKYTQQQVDAMCEDAFKAAREQREVDLINNVLDRIRDGRKYPTFQDYKQSKP